MRLDGAIGSEVERESRLTHIVLFKREAILNESGDGLAFKVLTDLGGVLPDVRVGRIKGHGVVEHELKIRKQGICVDVTLLEDAMFNVTQADRPRYHLIVSGIRAPIRERFEVGDERIAS